MRALLQRVSQASVSIAGQEVARIGPGLLVFVGIEKNDSRADADRLLHKLLAYRIFPDAQGHMNISVSDAGGGLLLVSQFTLAADTSRGLRPGFSTAMPPGEAESLYDYLLSEAARLHPEVNSGRFGANMQVALVNEGPVTFLLES
ncbi:MAG: D-aminoacyl-tRNA deacylase [Pseudomonadales bacterium]|nr:D-aminoacyl-tRNA deacylase [Pseudomonadales bacterium]